jgi:hypothetical protein
VIWRYGLRLLRCVKRAEKKTPGVVLVARCAGAGTARIGVRTMLLTGFWHVRLKTFKVLKKHFAVQLASVQRGR